jgi:hypothetical protein
MRWQCRILLVASIGLVPALLARAAGIEDSNRFTPGATGTQFMIYVSQPLGSHVHVAPRFGLRLERLQPVAAVAGAPFALHLRHRQLIDLQFASDRAPRLEFGERYSVGYRLGAFAFEDLHARSDFDARPDISAGHLRR